jgi:hypothetical protein
MSKPHTSKDYKIYNEISKNLSSIKLPEGFHFKNVDYYVFPDSYTVFGDKNLLKKIFVLKQKKENIGVIKYYVNNGKIYISFIQGVKNNQIFRGWQEIIIKSFIWSCLPVLNKHPDYKVKYDSIISIREKLKKNPKYLESLLKSTNYSMKTISNLEEQLKNCTNEKTKKSIQNKIIAHKVRIDLKKEQYRVYKSYFSLVNGLRDRYFDKNGTLNFKKKRVANLLETYNKRQTTNKLINVLKKVQVKKRLSKRR